MSVNFKKILTEIFRRIHNILLRNAGFIRFLGFLRKKEYENLVNDAKQLSLIIKLCELYAWPLHLGPSIHNGSLITILLQ